MFNWWKRKKNNQWTTLYMHMGFNWTGPLPAKVTWDWANKCDMGPSMHEHIPPVVCPTCKECVVIARHDYWKIEDSGQYMVYTYSCPNGHGSYVSWA